jgi:hypothetical protein
MGDDSSIPFLIDALSDMSMHDGALYSKPGMETTRFWANESLKQLTNNDFGFVWNAPEKKRQKAINRWQQWYSQTIGATNVATPDANSGRR